MLHFLSLITIYSSLTYLSINCYFVAEILIPVKFRTIIYSRRRLYINLFQALLNIYMAYATYDDSLFMNMLQIKN